MLSSNLDKLKNTYSEVKKQQGRTQDEGQPQKFSIYSKQVHTDWARLDCWCVSQQIQVRRWQAVGTKGNTSSWSNSCCEWQEIGWLDKSCMGSPGSNGRDKS